MIVVAVVLVGLALTAVLLIQHFPFSPLSSATLSGMKANCSSMIEHSIVTAGSGMILFGCNARTGWPPTWVSCPGGCPSAYPGFNVSQTSDYTPTFMLPQYYVDLFVAGTRGCSPPSGSGSVLSQLTNGTGMRLSGSSSLPNFFYYCARYASVPQTGATLSSFTVSWESGSTVFIQSFPSVGVPSEPLGGCGATALDSVTPITPVNGVLEFECMGNSGSYPGFAVSASGSYTPTFTLPQYYSGLSITPIADSVSNCTKPASGYPLPTPITSGTQVVLTSSAAAGGYYYCTSYASVPANGGTLPGLTVSWSSGSTVLLSQTIPSVLVPAKTTALSVVRGNNNILYYATFAGSWSSWQPLPLGASTTGPTVLCSGDGGTLYLAVRGSDNISLYLKSYSSGVWSDLTTSGGTTSAEPACASMNGTLHLLVRGLDDGIYYRNMNETSGAWSPSWLSLNGILLSAPALAASPSLHRLDVVVQGASGAISHKAYVNGAWSQTWDSPPTGGITADIPAISSDGRTLHLVVRGADNGVYYSALNFTTGSWSSWASLNGTTGITPSLATDSSGTVHLFVIGSDGIIHDKSLPPGGVWSSTWDSPTGATSHPVAVTTEGTTVAIMVSGTNGQIWYNTLALSVWQGWTILGGSTPLEPALSSIS